MVDVVSVLVTASASGVFALAGVVIANYFSDKRETIAYLRCKQDAHTELVRKEYVAALEAMGISLNGSIALLLTPDKAEKLPEEIIKIINRDALLNAKLRLSLLPAPGIILTSFDQLQHAMISFPNAPDALDAHVKALEDLGTTITNAMQQHLGELETEPERSRHRGLLRRG